MKILEKINFKLGRAFISDFDNTYNNYVRLKYGLLAGWLSVAAIIILFIIKMVLGLITGSISVVANAFHLLSHLANSVILVVSFKVTARPATAKNPFGHGRMEHVAPLIMAIFLFVSGIQIGETAVHQALKPHKVHYWNALPWILLATVIVKQWLAQFIRFLGKRVQSHAILTNASHQNIEAVMSLTVIGGLIAGHIFHLPQVDGYIGILVSVWLLFLGFTHGREALIPLLGQAPSRDLIRKIRETAKSVDGVEDVHEIIVHDYSSMNLLSLHVEIREKFGPAEIHEITERCEWKLRKTFGGEVTCHSDPLLEHSPEIKALEENFKKILDTFPEILDFHDFRVVIESKQRRILVADIDVKENIPDSDFKRIANNLESKIKQDIPNIAYSRFYITPKYSY